MQEVTVVIPNYNGIDFVGVCLDSIRKQNMKDFAVILVDNGSTDGSRQLVETQYPEVQVIGLKENTGFCRAVNEGIRASVTPYVILLNNDTQAAPDFVGKLLNAIKCRKKAFSCGAKMIQFHNRDCIDDAGNLYNALGWAYARGKGRPEQKYNRSCRVFSTCGGASIYCRSVLDEIGFFDEEHFAYLEDTDIGYRARIQGYENWFIPEAVVYHIGSGTSGSRYNQFKIRYSSRNNIYMLYKNMPIAQLILNLPLLILGFGAKIVFFAARGFGREYVAGIKNGFLLSKQAKKQGKKVTFRLRNLKNYAVIQGQLWWNIIRRLTN